MTDLVAETESHQLDDEELLGQAHSFSFWVRSVESHLEDRPFGADPEAVEPSMQAGEVDDLIMTLCNSFVGETAALDASSGLVRSATNPHPRILYTTRVADEARHLEGPSLRRDYLAAVERLGLTA